MTTFVLEWAPSPHARRLLSVAVLATIASVLTGRPELLALAGPALLLLLTARRGRPATEVTVTAAVAPERCLEGDQVDLAVDVLTDAPARLIRVEMTAAAPLHTAELPRRLALLRKRAATAAVHTDRLTGSWPLVVADWGRWSAGTATVVIRDPGGLRQAVVRARVGNVIVYPEPSDVSQLVLPEELRRRIGAHVSRSPGSGVEFAGIRPYVPGDAPKEIHWAASLRQGQLQVAERAEERSADAVIAVDAFSDVAGSLHRSVRGAAGVARGYLRYDDRVGLVVLGGTLRILPPSGGQRTYYRVLDAVLEVRRDGSAVTPEVARVPRHDLPSGAVVVLFSPLLDPRALGMVQDLHSRRVSILVVDVLTTEPPMDRRPSPLDLAALRLWRLDRAALRQRLTEQGVQVVRWGRGASLDEVIAPAAHLRPQSGRPA